MRVTRKIWMVKGAPYFRIPADAGFSVEKIYRLIMDAKEGTIEIVRKAIPAKKHLHETAYNGTLIVDRSTIKGTKNGPTIRLFNGMPEGEVEVEYEPGGKKIVLRIAPNSKS